MGVWNLDAQYLAGISPVSSLTFIASQRSTTIPTNTISGKTQGFLGIIWQTGFNNGSYPVDVTSPGWTRVSGGIGLLSGLYWRMNLQVKILSLSELGTSITPIAYNASNINVLLFGTNDNIPISLITTGSAGFSAGTGALSRTIDPTGETNKTLLYLSQMYNSSAPINPTFTGATATVLSGASDHQLRYYISPKSEINKPVVTTGMSSGSYNHMSAQYIGVV
jgi:hypothetical protein